MTGVQSDQEGTETDYVQRKLWNSARVIARWARSLAPKGQLARRIALIGLVFRFALHALSRIEGTKLLRILREASFETGVSHDELLRRRRRRYWAPASIHDLISATSSTERI